MSYPNSPFLLKGALIYFGAPMLIPIPNIIVFQYNPETLTRTLTPWRPLQVPKAGAPAKAGEQPPAEVYTDQRTHLSQPYDPKESFTLVLELDASDALENPE